MPEESTPLDLHNFALSGITGTIGTASNLDVVLASVDLVVKGVLDTNDLVTIKAALDAAAAAAEAEGSGSGGSRLWLWNAPTSGGWAKSGTPKSRR